MALDIINSIPSDGILCGLLSLGIVFTYCWLLRFRDRLSINRWEAFVLSFVCMLLGVLSVALFAKLEHLGEPGRGGISLFGGVFFMPVFFMLGAKWLKRDMATVFDALTIPLIVAMICGRVNCLLTGCCEGLHIPGINGVRWPTREAELVFYLLFELKYAPKVLKKETNGEVYPIYMMAYGVFRFIVETFRVSPSTDRMLHISHLWAVVSFIIGLSVYLELMEKEKRRR